MSYSTPDDLMMSFSHWGMFPISLKIWHETELERNPLFDVPMIGVASKRYTYGREEGPIDYDRAFRSVFGGMPPNVKTGEEGAK